MASAEKDVNPNRVLTGQIESLTFEDVRAFCKLGIEENVRLDYKSDPPKAKKIARLAAAFANTEGGVILFGVTERDRQPVEPFEGMSVKGDLCQIVNTACAQLVFPSISPRFSRLLTNPNDQEKAFFVVRIDASESVHQTDGGRGIYVRINDEKHPVLATYEQIMLLSNRRERAIALQKSRRRGAAERLGRVVGLEGKKGVLRFSVGPYLSTGKLLEARELREQAENISSVTYGRDRRGQKAPFRSLPRVETILDGVFEVNEASSTGSVFDVFGNAMTVAALAHRSNVGDCDGLGRGRGNITCDEESGAFLIARASDIAERLIMLLAAARALYRATGFCGLLSMRLVMDKIAGMPLFVGNVSNGPVFRMGGGELAVCTTTDMIELSDLVPSDEMNDPIVDSVRPLVERLLWAWGCSDAKADLALDNGERLFDGVDSCGCGRDKPKKRKLCLGCRAKPATKE